MKSKLRYDLSKLEILYLDDPIPWDIINAYPAAEGLLSEMIIAKTYSIISIVMDYPLINNLDSIYIRTSEYFKENNVSPYWLSDREREHLILIATYKLARRYIKQKHSEDLCKYMSRELPLYYIREVIRELNLNYHNESDVSYTEELSSGDNISDLPSSPSEYISQVKTIGVSKYTNSYSFYNRTHLYRILNRSI